MATRAKNRAQNRPERIPVSGRRDIMTVADKDPAFVYRWVTDVDNRIARFLSGGYEHVTDKYKVGQDGIDSSTDVSSMTTYTSGDRTQYLMRISKDFYNEDRVAKDIAIDDKEADMKRNLNSGKDGTYGSVNIT